MAMVNNSTHYLDRVSDPVPYVRGEISIPAHSFVSRYKNRLALGKPYLDASHLYFFVWFCRGDGVAMVKSNTHYFGMTVEFSRPKW